MDESETSQIDNIYAKQAEKKTESKAEKQAKERAQKISKKKDELKAGFLKFSQTLKDDDFDKAVKIKTDLIENLQVPEDDLAKIKVTTSDVFKKGFQFPEVAKNDFAAELFDELEIA